MEVNHTESKQTEHQSGTLLVILAGICWGMISIFVRGLTAIGLNSLQIMFIRAWVSVVLLFLYFLVKNPGLLKISPKDIWMFVGSGILSLTFFSYCYFSSILMSGAAISVVLLYTSPIFVMLMSALAFGEKITRKKLIALVLTFAGCVLVAGLIGSGSRLTGKALLLGLGAGFGYALYSIFAGFAVRKYSSLTVTFYTLLFSGLALPFLTDAKAIALTAADGGSKGWLYMLGIALICTVIPYITYTMGLGRMEAGKAAVLVTVEPLVGALLGIAAYHEAVDGFKISGIAMIFGAVILLAKKE